MSEGIFRKKSMERIQAPENLNDYIRVVNPGVWLVLTAALLLLAGACIWGIFGRIESTVGVHAYVENGVSVCTVQDERGADVRPGMTVRIGSKEGTVTEAEPKQNLVTFTAPVENGSYDVLIVLESMRPFSFVFD